MHRETKYLRVPLGLNVQEYKGLPDIKEAANNLKMGNLVAFPTETVYGLGAIATSVDAVANIFLAKGRPQDNPLIVHMGSVDEALGWAQFSKTALKLVEKFWPGPLTLVLPHKNNFASNVTAGLHTVGLRIPDNPIALALLQLTNIPVAAPSANLSTKISPTLAKHVLNDLDSRVDYILDGGPTFVGIESTVLDLSEEIPVLLRPGSITIESLSKVIGDIKSEHTSTEKPKSPGMKYKHYAPQAKMFIVEGTPSKVRNYIQKRTNEEQGKAKKVGILTSKERFNLYTDGFIVSCGELGSPQSIVGSIYKSLREFDYAKVDIILVDVFPKDSLLLSFWDRLYKAAGGNIISVN